MRFQIGHSEYHQKQKNQSIEIDYAPELLNNGHLLICGKSGVGKSHQLRRFISHAAASGISVDVFDVHHDLNVPASSSVLFSEQNRYGYNPLEVSLNQHSGGVRKAINRFIGLINSTGFKLGTRQESVLRNLLSDVYFLNGIYTNNPKSWHRASITEAIREDIFKRRAFNELRKYYPTLLDVISYCERKLKSLYLGADTNAHRALEEVNRVASQIQRMTSKMGKPGYDDSLDLKLEKAKDKAIDAYTEYVRNILSGRELDEVIKYNSKDTLQSVLERLQRLEQTGIFSSNPPPFHPEGLVRNYQIKHLSDDEQKMLIYTRAEQIFREARDSGVKDRMDRVIVLDEATKFLEEDKSNIFNIIAKEARKFGLGLWCAAQSPKGFSEDFISTVGTTMLLPIHTMFWSMACRKLKIDEKVLRFCKSRKVAAVKMDFIGESNSRYNNVVLPQEH